MGKKSSDPPPAPDPYKTAEAQTSSNVNTAIANTALSNADEYSPFGTVRYDERGTQHIGGGTFNSETGKYEGGGYDIPLYDRTVTLSPQQQALFDTQSALGLKTNQVALSQADRIANILNTPIAAAPTLTSLGGDLTATRDRAEAALMSRLNPQLAQTRSTLESRLVNQGLSRGTEAFNDAIDEAGRQENDARLAVIGQAGTEEDRLFNEAVQRVNSDNSVAQQNWQNSIQSRTEPINEISALMGLGQVTVPQAPAYQPGNVAGTPVGQYVYQSAQQQLDAWKTQEQQKAAAMGSLFGLGSAIVGGLAKSDRRQKRDIEPIGVRLMNGLPLYAYHYNEESDDEPLHVGVMADEAELVVPNAVITMPDGFKAVDYGQVF